MEILKKILSFVASKFGGGAALVDVGDKTTKNKQEVNNNTVIGNKGTTVISGGNTTIGTKK